MTWLLVAFLAVHGLLHLAIWAPRSAPVQEPPFHPDHSAVLTTVHAPAETVRVLAFALAAATAVTYLFAAVVVVLGVGWAVPAALAAALGLLLKVLYFHPWLLLGIGLDALVLAGALRGWPWDPA